MAMSSESNLDNNLKSDLKYIENDVITIQPNGCLIRYSRMLNAVVFMDKTVKSHIEYWEKRYAHHKKEKAIIIKALKAKLKNGTTSIDDMIELVKNSHDTDKEIEKALECLMYE